MAEEGDVMQMGKTETEADVHGQPGGRGRKRMITRDGETKSIEAWADQMGVSRQRLSCRIREQGLDVAFAPRADGKSAGDVLDLRMAAQSSNRATVLLQEGDRPGALAVAYHALRAIEAVLRRSRFPMPQAPVTARRGSR